MNDFIADEIQLRVHNNFSNYPLKGFGKQELFFFLMLCTKVKSSEDLRIRINYKDHICESYHSAVKVKEQLSQLAKKLVKASDTFINSKGHLVIGTFFYNFDFHDDHVVCFVNEGLVEVLVNVSKQYTLLDLHQIFSLRSPYSIKLYRKLKQFEYTGKYMTNIDDFTEIMGISSATRINNIMARIVNPAVDELKAFFPKLSVEKIVDSAPGSPVTGLNFTWAAKKALTDEQKAIVEGQKGKKKSYKAFDEREYSEDEMLDLERKLLDIK